jgi:predicted TIM-barrel fold metal-dependent hydrolase
MCGYHARGSCSGRLPRRRAFGLLAVLAASALARARAAEAAGPYAGPLVDAHAHLKDGIGPDPAGLLALHDRIGVQGALLFGEPWSLATDARDLAPGRIVPILAEGYANALHPDASYMHPDGLAGLFAANVVRGLGEIICRHSAFQLGASGGYYRAPANDVPADHPALVEAYRVAGSFGGPVTIHQEWWFADELERAARAAPDTPIIWAHAGHGDVTTTRRLLERNPNLHADLSARSPWLGPGTVLTRSDGSLDPAWAALLRDHADRFLVGLDLFVPAHYQTEYAGQMVGYYRGLLGQLEPDVAALIATGNAARLAPFATG